MLIVTKLVYAINRIFRHNEIRYIEVDGGK